MGRLRHWASLGFLVAYVAAVVIGRQSTLPENGLALFWPAAGIAALWSLRATRKRGLLLDAVLLTGATVGTDLALQVALRPALLFGLANLVLAVVLRLAYANVLAHPVIRDQHAAMAVPRDLHALALASLAAALCSAPIGALASWSTTGRLEPAVFPEWVTRNACGALLVAAVVLALRPLLDEHLRPRMPWREALTSERRPHAVAELVLALVVSVACGYLVFGDQRALPIGFVMIAIAAWLGVRFAPVVGALHTLLFGAWVVVAALLDRGPFVTITSLAGRAMVIQVFIGISAMVALMLSVGVADRIALLERLRTSEEDAQERAVMLDAITQVMSDGLTVVDDQGRVVFNNPAAEALASGASEHGALAPGSQEHGFFALDGSELPTEMLPHVRALAGEEVPATDLLRIDPVTGVHTVLSVSAVPLTGILPDGEPLAVLGIHDVTRERASVRDLQNFAGVVAHDLKNPLTAMMAWTELLDDDLVSLGEEAASARASLLRIYQSTDRMQVLINDLLAYTRSQSADIRPEQIDLDDLVDGLARDLERHSVPAPEIDHDLLGEVIADRALVHQLLANVLGNAVKYVAPEVRPHVLVSARRQDDMVEVQVSDNGVGIPWEDRDKIFDTFFRSRSTADYPGTGLGLAICARVVERHGGWIRAVRGPRGIGTTVIFTLPSGEAVSVPPQAPAAPAPEPEPTRLVLIDRARAEAERERTDEPEPAYVPGHLRAVTEWDRTGEEG